MTEVSKGVSKVPMGAVAGDNVVGSAVAQVSADNKLFVNLNLYKCI